MSNARLVDVADGVAAAIAATWAAVSPDGVVRTWPFRIDLDQNDALQLLRGRRVWVLPVLPELDPLTREHWKNKYQVGVLLAERYAAEGDPPDDWIDARVKWWQDNILYPLCDPALTIAGPAGVVTAAKPDPGQLPQVNEFIDPEELIQLKLLKISATFAFIDASDHTGG